ncbi:terminase small subunit [Azomonas agilis]|uniref:Terminase small subunit n=1 Tax=Azomonas agilis TaxID=116849 RepID=A0A562HYR0_9GAMM|nr:terminase small subunit [Azomonas agilis]TWH63900.1 terminase small subunit [Azomonas agilis]
MSEPMDYQAQAKAFGISLKELMFVEYFLANGLNATRAYLEAGYRPKNAANASAEASRCVAKHRVKTYLGYRLKQLIGDVEAEKQRLIQTLTFIAFGDVNELVEHRRACCRFCHGEDFRYQYTPDEYRQAEQEAEEQGKDFDPQGGIGFDANKDPNPKCPECFGRGVSQVIFHDTRHLSPAAQALYAGFEHTKVGKKVVLMSKEKAFELLAKIHKLFDDAPKVTLALDVEALEQRFAERMRRAHERTQALRQERGLTQDEPY